MKKHGVSDNQVMFKITRHSRFILKDKRFLFSLTVFNRLNII
jgi:hypothetical protein